ncbi:hypothetical protein F9U64_11910 [Gracilibacillus oryzae]|uniref:Uncharacterized protein n=1 Tax=Gracilibacillus oryzae TaxID=1672701 RepID=A0A7C8KUM0_9BACI|nr:hypothetical protein [Gracilibacillus oryzae]KAB8133609.1 hypothetical protein F9U64_11910 [Gracilibacillus oryzae]
MKGSKKKFLLIIFVMVISCSCSSNNNVTENDVILQFVESTVVKGDFKQALQLSKDLKEDQLREIYQEVESGYRDSYNKVDIYVTSDGREYLSYIPDYRIIIELNLSNGDKKLVNNVSVNHPSLEETERIWKSNNWESRIIEFNDNEF